MNFVKKGTGKKTLVFLHGWGGSWQSWGPIIHRLQTTDHRLQIYALDLPGFGLSELKRPYDLTDYVTDLTEFFHKNKITKPVLIGHSFGGQIAIKFAIEQGNLLSKLVLVDAAGIRDNSLKIKLNIKIASIGRKLLLETPFDRFFPALRRVYYQLKGFKDSDYFKITDPYLRSTASKIFREDLTGELEKITLPTLIVWGEKDNYITPLEYAHLINQKISGSKLLIFPNAGHFSYLEDQERFCKELEKFV